MTIPMRVALCAGASFLAIISSGAVQAADAPASSTEIQEIVVTAQKREERLLDVPLPVQSISQDRLDKAGISKVADLTSSIPGASLVSGTTPGFETIQIRGIASGTTGDGLVSYYVGDTPHAACSNARS
jgi:outer membrane receptor protein involved in Fe transport